MLASTRDVLTAWCEFYEKLPRRGIYHFPQYLGMLENVFGDEAELFVFGDAEEFVYYPYLKTSLAGLPFAQDLPFDPTSRFDISSSWYYGGPLVRCAGDPSPLFAAFIDAFAGHARDNGFVSEFIRLDANIGNHTHYGDAARYNRETVYVDLTQSREVIFADTSSANRRAVRKAERAGFAIHETEPSDVARWKTFHAIYDSEMYRKDAPPHLYFSWEFFDRVRTLPERSILLTVERDGEMAGGFIAVYEGDYAFHFLSASKPEYWIDRINNFLFTSAILWSREQGCKLFDFMGGRAGVYKFKTNFSSTRGRFYTYSKVLEENVYGEASGAYVRHYDLPESRQTSYFPAYREPIAKK